MGKPVLDPAPAYESPPPYITVQPTSSAANVVIESDAELDHRPATLTCPNCRILVATRVEHKSTVKTHLCALSCALICCWPLVCVAYCGGMFNTFTHYCPNCDSLIGTYDLKCCGNKQK